MSRGGAELVFRRVAPPGWLCTRDLSVLSVDVTAAVVRGEAQCTTASAVCPGCGDRSRLAHGSYLRFSADVPTAGRRMVLRLRVRRFICRNASCHRRTFVEQVNGLPAGMLSGLSGSGGSPFGQSLRGGRQPQYRPASGRRTPRTGSASPAESSRSRLLPPQIRLRGDAARQSAPNRSSKRLQGRAR
ncbi:transposase family protein [Streptomyces sp. NPDC046324]|uniref:transposase family protein n=1 Tax=Streptomyces sp. NPDC046324 TaxID=3154915 RepID=UPI003401824A